MADRTPEDLDDIPDHVASPDADVVEYLSVQPIEGEIQTEPLEDGSLLAILDEEEDNQPDREKGGFYENLADGVIPYFFL